MDGRSRIATIRVGNDVEDPTPTVKFNLEDHLGTSSVMVNTGGDLINREEYYPFGETSFGAFAKKRYRYVGKEKDNESGLYYYGARYYAAWVGRFVSVDPLASKYPQLTPYNYAANDPIGDLDIDGMQNTKTAEGGGSGGGSAKQVPDQGGLPTFELPAVEIVGVASETLPWYLGENKYGGKPVLTLGLGTLPTTTPMNYDKTSWTNPSEKLAVFITNAGIGLWNTLATGWNEAIEGKTSSQSLMEAHSSISHALGHATWEDVKNVSTDVRTYENVAGLLVAAWLAKRVTSTGVGKRVFGEAVEGGMVKGKYSGRTFDPAKAGGAVASLDWAKASINSRGITEIRTHLARLDPSDANQVMLTRLDEIALGKLKATDWDKRFYTHELQELNRTRAAGFSDLHKLSYDEWNNLHSATLEDFMLHDDMIYQGQKVSTLYHPSVGQP